MLWQHGEKKLEKFLEFLNCYHPTIKFTANYSREEIILPDVSVRKKNNHLITDLSNLQTRITLKSPYLTVRRYA